MCSFIYQEK